MAIGPKLVSHLPNKNKFSIALPYINGIQPNLYAPTVSLDKDDMEAMELFENRGQV